MNTAGLFLLLRKHCTRVIALGAIAASSAWVNCDTCADDALLALANAETPTSFEKAYRDLVARSSKAAMAELLMHDDTSVALRAAWDEMVVNSPAYGKADRLRDQQGTYLFLGFIEGRLRLRLPKWWTSSVLDATYGSDGAPRFTCCEPWSMYVQSESPFKVRAGNLIRISDGTVTIGDGTSSLSMPESVLTELSQGGANEQLDVLFGETTSYLACHSSLGHKYQLLAIDTKARKVRWRANVWGAGVTKSFGSSYHSASIILRDNHVTVLGVDPKAVYLERFSVTDGTVRFRFCTGYPWTE